MASLEESYRKILNKLKTKIKRVKTKDNYPISPWKRQNWATKHQIKEKSTTSLKIIHSTTKVTKHFSLYWYALQYYVTTIFREKIEKKIERNEGLVAIYKESISTTCF